MKKIAVFTAAASLAVMLSLHPTTVGAEGPTVIELYTSQSCYSCPPAEAYLGELASRDDVVALEFHVDYWNSYVHGAAGRWKDVFSKPENTNRQRLYNLNLRGKPDAYTPQMVIHGTHQAVGSRRGAVRAAIKAARADGRERVSVSVSTSDGLSARVTGKAMQSADIWLVRFDLARETKVRAGENRGKTLINHHVVTEARRIGAWTGSPVTVRVADLRLAANESCAVVVQGEKLGRILGAAACQSN